MPRRPRPTGRAPPKRLREDDDDDDEDVRDDRPRFSQWVPEEELDAVSDVGSGSEPEPDVSGIEEGESGSDSETPSDHDSDSDSDSSSGPETTSTNPPKPEWTTAKRKRDIAKRSSKHAPTEVTSKRPVSRHRSVVDVPVIETRDPRFTPLAGQLSQPQYSRSYSFITDLQKGEAESLRASLAKARKQRAPWETIESLERALKRAESAIEKAKRDEREREALEKVRKEEKEKRQGGKGAWYMKKSEKRELLLKAKFDDLAASGGQNAVRKAIDKRKKKIAQKEKKARPFSKAQARAFSQGAGPSGGGRPSTSGSHGNKRQRI
ncbi:rRNA biogenesis protein RRP36 OS=Laccaria bicolor (strain S238N-H82 / ATCC MYA-4686) GN=RRP36 PE=3 SV=1 [Rhizoctonia solani AG-1 IB]|uniref:rRNA biogenesis protein RRP36 n=1 Tax=Thanatephorus cucumeris (strain AG1-IB / isolate 7/3/14) TaxID=1108050 RepID=A0A0B7FNZ9_THACB|nr:rRNA biogenesis protein RRP36 OS=Laccaria bicolor (strain S238N-H82 / ATCC MYA-4686) GN=RRP36 PE=3 SV=1 [Rhizoctonia solani AG-1 IB]